MELKDILDIILIPVSLALLPIIWTIVQNSSKRYSFRNLILRELEELTPYPGPEHANPEKYEGWWAHQNKKFVHQQILQDVSKNRDFILSLEPELVYFVSQLWDAKNNRDKDQWLNYLEELSVCKYDRSGKIKEAAKQWRELCKEYKT